MYTKIHWIFQTPENGKLGMMARPRGNDWLEDEIRNFKMREVNGLVSLLERGEELDLGLENEKKECLRLGIEFRRFPIKDRELPKDKKAFLKIGKEIWEALVQGQCHIVHCRMGIGRATLMAAVILSFSGLSFQEVMDLIEKARGLTVPDTKEQSEWLKEIFRA